MAESVQWGYDIESGIIEINDSPAPQKQVQGKEVVQQIAMPLRDFDQIVKDYLARREGFVQGKLVDGVLFDDSGDIAF